MFSLAESIGYAIAPRNTVGRDLFISPLPYILLFSHRSGDALFFRIFSLSVQSLFPLLLLSSCFVDLTSPYVSAVGLLHYGL